MDSKEVIEKQQSVMEVDDNEAKPETEEKIDKTLDLGDTDDDSIEDGGPKKTMEEAIKIALECKDKANELFKAKDHVEARKSWEEGIEELKDFKNSGAEEVKSLLLSLHGNCAMAHIKDGYYNKAINSATLALKYDSKNIKAMYRRGLAYNKIGSYDDAKRDLTACIELDSTNGAAKKELADTIKNAKEALQKEKAALKAAFSKGMYNDKEKERQKRLQREEEEKQKERDDWTKSKLQRRADGKEEQTFEEWKKEKKELEEKEAKEREQEQEKNRRTEKEKKAKLKSERKVTKNVDDNDDDDYDEEEAKILSETKAKGYCYFRNTQSSESKSLIGDITPKAVTEPSIVKSDSLSSTGEAISTSSWNTAGTWEERDMTSYVKNRFEEMCINAMAEDDASVSNPEATKSAVSSILDPSTSTTDKISHLQSLDGVLLPLTARVTKIKSVEGEAQIVMARGKKRHIYDFALTLSFEAVLESHDKKSKIKPKKFQGTLHWAEVSPVSSLEFSIDYKEDLNLSTPDTKLRERVRVVSNKLGLKIQGMLELFEEDYKAL